MSRMWLRFPARMELDGWVRSRSSVNMKSCSTGRFLRKTQENYYPFQANSASTFCTHSVISIGAQTCSPSKHVTFKKRPLQEIPQRFRMRFEEIPNIFSSLLKAFSTCRSEENSD